MEERKQRKPVHTVMMQQLNFSGNIKLFYAFAAFLLLPAVSFAQETKDTLNEIIIVAPRMPEPASEPKSHFMSGQEKLTFDSSLLSRYGQRSLAELIREQSPVFVKSYGVNNLATLSIRGASAAQSKVLWNGVPITNASSGLSDLSLFQGGLFQNVSIQYGGSSALLGSGNVGGALLLEDNPPLFRPETNVSLSLGSGSFGHWNGLLHADWENHHWHIGVKAFLAKAKNDFSYETNQGVWKEMKNARLSASGAIFSADYLFPNKKGTKIKRQTLAFKAWYQQYYRQIPPALFETFSVKQQQDKDFRSLLLWQQRRERSDFYFKFSFVQSSMNYQDGVVLPDNKNQTNQWFAEGGWKWKINNPIQANGWLHELMVFVPVQWAFATGGNLTGKQWQFRPALAAAYKCFSADRRFDMNFSLRREWWQQHAGSWLPGWNVSYLLAQRPFESNFLLFSLRADVQRSYRVPNISELYYSPGGNPELLPERGWNEEGGFTLQLNFHQKIAQEKVYYAWKLTNTSSIFNRNTQDWIYWLGGSIWTPHNLAEVHSRGVETESKISWKTAQVTQWNLSVKTAYVLATTTASYLPNDNSIGSQIPYTPRYNGMASLSFSGKWFFVAYNHQYTGYRFTTTDESQYLTPYQTGNFILSCTFYKDSYSATLMAQVRNLWDERFEIVNGRPMPGRNYAVSINLSWKK